MALANESYGMVIYLHNRWSVYEVGGPQTSHNAVEERDMGMTAWLQLPSDYPFGNTEAQA